MSSISLLYSSNQSDKTSDTSANNKHDFGFKKGEITEDMSPKDIANIISDHLISYVDKAFESTFPKKQ